MVFYFADSALWKLEEWLLVADSLKDLHTQVEEEKLVKRRKCFVSSFA